MAIVVGYIATPEGRAALEAAIVEAERHVLALLEAGCAAPIGAHGQIDDGLLFLDRVDSLTADVFRRKRRG